MLLMLAWSGVGSAQDEVVARDASGAAAMTASELLQAGKEAFERRNFSDAEANWQQLDTDFGENEEVRLELARIRPLLAIAKVATGEFEGALGMIDASLGAEQGIPKDILEQLRFWRGVCLLKSDQLVEAQRAFGEFYAEEAHDYERRMEAMVLFGMAYLMQEEFAEADTFFRGRLERLEPGRDSETRGRIAVLQLHALMEAKRYDQALTHLKEWFPRMEEITQLAAFQSLALRLGAHFLDQENYYASIQALQRIWPRERLLKHQRVRLLDLEARHTGMKLRKANQDAIYKIEGMITRVRREIENFEAIANFDSALRLRLAMAYQGLERYREAGLILEEMLARMPDDPIVEQASVRLVQNWMQARRWGKAVQAADMYVTRFGATRSGNMPTVLFLRADALQNSTKYGEAISAFDAVIDQFPRSEMVPKCVFMKGVCHLNAGNNGEAVTIFKELQKKYPKNPLFEDADYWMGMAWSFAGEHQRAREHLKAHLKRYPAGRYKADSVFRRAFSLFAIASYANAIAELRAFASDFPESQYVNEARLLLGDSLGAVGEIEDAVAAYSSIEPRSPRYYEEGQFKIGKALRLTAQHDRLRKHFADFIDVNPGSLRLVEAVYWIGWSHLAEENVTEARQIYWDTIEKHGDDPAVVAVEDILTALPKLYQGGARAELNSTLNDVSARAQSAGRSTLLARTAWAEAAIVVGWDARRAESSLLRAARLLDPKVHSARMLADCADARFRAGQYQLAEQLYRGLRKWNPRAVEKERAYLGLGRIASAEGDAEAALEWFSRAAKAAVSTGTIAEALLAKAQLEVDLDRSGDAQITLDELLGSKFVDGRSKAQGLLAYGRALEGEGDPLKATAYYQRVYVAYGKHRDLVAKAYLAQGQALEQLAEQSKALEVYRELASRDDLSGFAESELVRERIAALNKDKEVLQ